ncbi:alpha/beta hydrolase [Zhongshania marina]|uniref:Alpha/beta hydrolase n=1 Tax=Zhongshania marina TaxID=2304603 RepID=A0ABX9W4W3_9GAMM|nr:alpha/beta hydrolase [Zhongshania marina]
MASIAFFLLVVSLSGLLPLRYRQLKVWSALYWPLSIAGQLFVVPITVVAVVIVLAWRNEAWVAGPAFVALFISIFSLLRQFKVRNLTAEMALRLGVVEHGAYSLSLKDIWSWLLVLRCERRGINIIRDVAYGDLSAQRLDIYALAGHGEPKPILIHIHGGAWVTGKKGQMGRPLVHDMAQQGWLVCDIEYRLGPEHRYPAMIVDVLSAIHWIKTNAEQYGGRGDFVAVTGGSAGGHLTALTGLMSADQRREYVDGDTSVQLVAPFYGRYDLLDRFGIINDPKIDEFTESKVMPGAVEQVGEALWRQASPIDNVGPHMPSCLMVHGSSDCLIDYKEAEAFVNAQAALSVNDFEYLLVPGAQHAFDLGHCPQSDAVNRLIQMYFEKCYRDFCKVQGESHL